LARLVSTSSRDENEDILVVVVVVVERVERDAADEDEDAVEVCGVRPSRAMMTRIPARASTSRSSEGGGTRDDRPVVDVRRARGRAMDKAWHRTFIKTRPRMSARQKKNHRELFPRHGIAFDASVGVGKTRDGRWRVLDYDRAFEGRREGRRRVLELGFGLGDNLVESADVMRETHVFVGAEVHRPGVASALGAIDARGLDNVLVAEIDALWLLRDFCEESSLEELVIHFPDPWLGENKAHRRLVNPMLLELAERALAPNGRLSVATDADEYKAHVERVFRSFGEPRGWTPDDEPFARFESKYSKKARDEGRKTVDYAFRFAKPSRRDVDAA
tara:strand:- start:1779 stop:2774 length:996 start_codon:yes stop_codon:yes gene_type:complete